MRILYICNASNFLGIGGMEYHLIDITGWLQGHGVETALAVREGTYFHKTILNNKPNVYPLSWTGLHKFFSFIQVGKAIRDFSPDIISINRERDIIRVFLIAKLIGFFTRKRPKIVAVFHNAGWKKFYVLGHFDGIIFPTRYMSQGYLSKNNSAGPIAQTIYHGIQLTNDGPGDKFNPARTRRYLKGLSFPIIGMIGEMRKNQTELIDVAYHLKKKNIDFTIAFIGRGNEGELNVLKEKIDRLGLMKNIIFTGRVDRNQIPDVLYDLDISITTNRSEPFGIVHIESLAAYTPVVAYNSGGLIEILEHGGGVLVNGGPENMADELFTLITNHQRIKSLGIEGRDSVEKNFSIEAMGGKHLKFYSDIASKP